jgi:hypothetical protein
MKGRYYISLAEDSQGEDLDDEQCSYNLFDRNRLNEQGEHYCLIACGTYEQCQQEQSRLEQESAYQI